MLASKPRQSGLQAASLIAITYVYFLIFAQFAFLSRLTSLGVADAHLKAVLAAMAMSGILFSLLTPRITMWPSPGLRLRAGLTTSGAAAFLSLLPLNLAGSMAVSFLIGAGLGVLTVTLVTHLRQWTGSRNPLLMVGLGTGTGYLICNLPGFFNTSAESQATVAGLMCLTGIGISMLPSPLQHLEVMDATSRPSYWFVGVIACFAALIWLDSAAFFIIQNSPSLKAGTWQGSAHLWANGMLHLAAALASAWLLGKRSLWLVLTLSYLALGAACLLLLNPNQIDLASLFYPVGVSIYSVALVAYPSLLAPASSVVERGKQAGWIYAIAGWIGSAMGIGMAQNLGHVPPGFVLGAGVVVLAPGMFKSLWWRVREIALTVVVGVVAFCVYHLLPSSPVSAQPSQVDRGRRVYISEGCISCHSQYVRPNTSDVLMWGPVESIQELRQQQPPLIGNRRQGPDLAEVGGRRSPMWLKAHFFNPAEVSGASIMPSFGFLFNDERGDDLVAYLASLRTSGTAEHQVAEKSWKPSPESVEHADAAAGRQLYTRFCSTCHSTDGPTGHAWHVSFKRPPKDLTVETSLYYLSAQESTAERRAQLAQITKFGIPGTDMPGHEYLSDEDVASISLWLSENSRQPLENH
jgi:cytochrome c oxidase cbb3-type subunit 2